MNAYTFSGNFRFASFENNFSDEKFKFIKRDGVALAIASGEDLKYRQGFALAPPGASDDCESAFDAIFLLDLIFSWASRGSAYSWYLKISLARIFSAAEPT